MLTSALNPNVVKTALDDVFHAEFDFRQAPQFADANDALVFDQMESTKASETMEEFRGSGYWTARAETADPSQGQPMAVYQATATHDALARGIEISKHFMDDDQHFMWVKTVRDFAENGRVTRDREAFAIYRNGFSDTYGDAVALFATTHPITGGTQSNTGTAKLNESTLNDAIVQLAEMKARDGVIKGCVPATLLVPSARFKSACMILESELRAGTANNDANVYSSKYNIVIKTTPWLGTNAGGSDHYWFLLARNHGIIRFNRQDINTNLIDWRQRTNRTYHYSGEFRQSTLAMSYIGAIGYSGTTGSYDA